MIYCFFVVELLKLSRLHEQHCLWNTTTSTHRRPVDHFAIGCIVAPHTTTDTVTCEKTNAYPKNTNSSGIAE